MTPDKPFDNFSFSEADFGALIQKVNTIGEVVARIERAIMGSNGSPGLMIEVDRVKSDVARFNKTYDEWRKVLIGVAVTIALSVGAFVWAVVVHRITIVGP